MHQPGIVFWLCLGEVSGGNVMSNFDLMMSYFGATVVDKCNIICKALKAFIFCDTMISIPLV